MSSLLVRNVDAGLAQLLRARAARHGRSAEAEHRLILEEALRGGAGPTGLDLWRELAGGPVLEPEEAAIFDEVEAERAAPPREPAL